MAEHFIGIDVGTGSARAGVFDASRPHARLRASATSRSSASPATSSSSRATTSGAPSAPVVREAVRRSRRRPRRRRRHRLRRDLLAGRARARAARRCRSGRRTIPSATSSSGWTTAPSSRPSASTPAGSDVLRLCRRHDLARDGDARSCCGCARTCPAIFAAAWQFFDLTDFLTWRATGSLARSSCTVTCKWTYLAHERRWDDGYFRAIGLGALADEGFAPHRHRGRRPAAPPLGAGLTDAAAAELGLQPGTPVAAGLIDAHAGGIGTVGGDGDPDALPWPMSSAPRPAP